MQFISILLVWYEPLLGLKCSATNYELFYSLTTINHD